MGDKIEKWTEQASALGLQRLVLSLDGFDPEEFLLGEMVEKGQETVTIDGHVFTEIDLYNGGYRFDQFTVPISTTYGEAAKLIDIVLQAHSDGRSSFLERMDWSDEDEVTDTIFVNVFIGS